MPDATLSVTIPPETWMADVSTSFPEATFRVLTVLVDGDDGFGLLEVRSDRPLAVLARLEACADLSTVDLVSADDRTAIVHLETTETDLLDPVAAAGVPIQTPFVVEDGVVVWRLTTPNDRLSDLGGHLAEAGLSYRVESVTESGDDAPGRDAVLTERQHEVLAHALEQGFFEIPRETTVDDVAAAFDVSKSTASDTLRRAQRNLTEWYFQTAGSVE